MKCYTTHNTSGLGAPTPRISICYHFAGGGMLVRQPSPAAAAAAQLCVVFSGWYFTVEPLNSWIKCADSRPLRYVTI